ncbi:NAD(+)/NADH kinase [Candidatus Nitrosotenuis chungbukensis]|uniref:NAD(+)/NADH kinase n=1 Tax=Candidatus Nitrosotenuis chungbukensis TaxID=1353246 RepID=UPI00267350DC|nr:NAD(+)/NADH kinase [Candidatus Nitrosotenuis chungbukensis]WKT57055.1 NAD(+)/NADH kinase [Candidatus Nitrosotenuis chungbukensis]
MKLNRVAIVSKFGSEESENVAKKVAKKFLANKAEVFTIAPVFVEGAKKIDTVDEISDKKLDLVVTLGGDGTTLRTFRSLTSEVPLLTINVGGNRGILSEITLDKIDAAINDIRSNKVWLDKRTRVVASVGGQEFPPR